MITKDQTKQLLRDAKDGKASYGLTYTCPRCTQHLIDDQNNREKNGTWDGHPFMGFRNLCDGCFGRFASWSSNKMKL